MKYGETLQQRSTPEWGNYNVDYNDLKRLIKVRTTRGQGQALTIPGHSNEAKALQRFEDEFFAQLLDQHQRVDLFVQSKAGEINRRLLHLDKQIGQLQQRYALHRNGKVPVKCLERYSKAEEAAEKAGEEIRSLARFVGAQRLAFIKLLKKYKRWTSSPSLEGRFCKKVLDRPGAFSKRDFEPLLTQYNDVLTAIRAPFDLSGDASQWRGDPADQPRTTNGPASSPQNAREQQNVRSNAATKGPPASMAMDLHATCQDGSDVAFDTALATLPLGNSGGKASYWVHLDHLVELHVLLLQHTRLRRTNKSNGVVSASNGGRKPSRRRSTHGNGNCLVDGGDDESGLIICDDLQDLARRGSSAPISDTKGSTGGFLEKSVATIRYSSGSEAVVAVSLTPRDAMESRSLEAFRKARTKKKSVRQLFRPSKSKSSTDKLAEDEDDDNLRCIQQRLSDHREIKPLVQLQCKRTRFVGLKNDERSGMWATLDRDILLRKTQDEFFDTEAGELNFMDDESSQAVRFPFAVLEIRYEGDLAAELLAALDETHLTERIRGFSLEIHAVATLCKPKGMPPPYWLPALDQDLRKLPATVKTATSRGSSKHPSPESSAAGRASTSATSVGEARPSSGPSLLAAESSATSLPCTPEPEPKRRPRRKRRIRKDRPLRQHIPTNRQQSHQHYWNEYDDGDENSDNEPFTIYIDPNKSTFPNILKAIVSLASHARASSKKVKLWLRSSDSPIKSNTGSRDDESGYFHRTGSPEDDSDFEESPTDPLLYQARQRQYSTFNSRHIVDHAFAAREALLARCCIACFVASFVLLVVAALLASTGRRKAFVKVDVGVITGVVSSLAFALMGMIATFKRRENVGIAHRLVVFTALAVVCVGGGMLVAGVVDS